LIEIKAKVSQSWRRADCSLQRLMVLVCEGFIWTLSRTVRQHNTATCHLYMYVSSSCMSLFKQFGQSLGLSALAHFHNHKSIASWSKATLIQAMHWMPCNKYPCRTSYFLGNQINVWNATGAKKDSVFSHCPHKDIIFIEISQSYRPITITSGDLFFTFSSVLGQMWQTALFLWSSITFSSACHPVSVYRGCVWVERCSIHVVLWSGGNHVGSLSDSSENTLRGGGLTHHHVTKVSGVTLQDAWQSTFPDLRVRGSCPPLLWRTANQNPEQLWSSWDGCTGHLRNSCGVMPKSRQVTQVSVRC